MTDISNGLSARDRVSARRLLLGVASGAMALAIAMPVSAQTEAQPTTTATAPDASQAGTTAENSADSWSG